MDERLVRAVQMRRDVQRGPLPREGSVYADESFGPTAFFVHPAAVSLLIVIAFALLLVSATAYYSTYSGALRWIVYAVILAALGYVAVRYAGSKAADPTRLSGITARTAGVGGDLKSLRTTVERADGGLVYSQVAFEDRMRKAFFAKVRSNRPFTREALDAAAKDPVRLQEVLGDRQLTLFVLEAARNMRAYPASVPTLPKKEAFARTAAKVLETMEAWR
jgi:hypothetical protein